MRRVKLFVFLGFFLFAEMFFGNRFTSVPVSGQGSFAAPTGVTASD
jgi:hypothetical protein